jgi:hypothetical protein
MIAGHLSKTGLHMVSPASPPDCASDDDLPFRGLPSIGQRLMRRWRPARSDAVLAKTADKRPQRRKTGSLRLAFQLFGNT